MQHKSTGILSPVSVLAYGVLSFPLSLGWIMLMMYVPTYYGVTVGIGLGLAGIIIACSRAFDIMADIVMGIISDRLRDGMLSRKLCIAIGLPVFCTASAGLLLPPDGANAVYLTGAILFYFLGYTLVEIPFSAIGLEVAKTSHQRSQLAAAKYGCLILGGLTGAALSLFWGGDPVTVFPNIVKLMIGLSLIILPIFIYYVPKTSPNTSISKSVEKTHNPFLLLKYYPSIRRIICLFFLLTLANCYGSTLSLLYVTHIIDAPEKLGQIWLCSGIGILLGLPLWSLISKKYGKIQTWKIAIALSIFALCPFLFFKSGDVLLMSTASFLTGLIGGCEVIMCISLLADAVAGAEKKGTKSFAGSLSALRYTVSKIAFAVPLLLAFPLLGKFELADTADISKHQNFVLIFLYAGVPILCRIGGYIYIKSWMMPHKAMGRGKPQGS